MFIFASHGGIKVQYLTDSNKLFSSEILETALQ